MVNSDRQPSTPEPIRNPAAIDSSEPPPRRCSSTVASTGLPCEAAPLTDSDRCWQHSANAAVAERRHLARVQGGMKKSKALKAAMAGVLQPADLSSAPGIQRMLQDAADRVRTGEISPSVANSLAQLASVSLRLVELTLDIREIELTEKALNEPKSVGGGHGIR
jgi:hypothetical protein